MKQLSIRELTQEMKQFETAISDLLTKTGYDIYYDLSGITIPGTEITPDQCQILEEYTRMLQNLSEMKDVLDYLQRPVTETSTLHKNANDRYEAASGREYLSGSGIEFLRQEVDYASGQVLHVWTRSFVEHNGKDYYIVDYPDVSLDGLEVRNR